MVANAPCLSMFAAAGGSATYRLDVELGRLTFSCHPGMAREEQLVGGWGGWWLQGGCWHGSLLAATG